MQARQRRKYTIKVRKSMQSKSTPVPKVRVRYNQGREDLNK
jgi:hypothetical protein